MVYLDKMQLITETIAINCCPDILILFMYFGLYVNLNLILLWVLYRNSVINLERIIISQNKSNNSTETLDNTISRSSESSSESSSKSSSESSSESESENESENSLDETQKNNNYSIIYDYSEITDN